MQNGQDRDRRCPELTVGLCLDTSNDGELTTVPGSPLPRGAVRTEDVVPEVILGCVSGLPSP